MVLFKLSLDEVTLEKVRHRKCIQGDSRMKLGAGTLVVLLRDVNFGFLSPLSLGCSGKNAIIFSRKGLF